jgi:hypothetical protein
LSEHLTSFSDNVAMLAYQSVCGQQELYRRKIRKNR